MDNWLIAGVAAVLLIGLIVPVLVDSSGQDKLLLFITDAAVIVFALAAAAYGYSAVKLYGGIIGEGLRYMIVGLVIIALFEVIDMLAHNDISIVSTQAKSSTVENIAVSVAMAFFAYGAWKMRSKTEATLKKL